MLSMQTLPVSLCQSWRRESFVDRLGPCTVEHGQVPSQGADALFQSNCVGLHAGDAPMALAQSHELDTSQTLMRFEH